MSGGTDLEREIGNIVRPTVPFRVPPSLKGAEPAPEAPLFSSIADASQALTELQERFDRLAGHLLGEHANWTPMELPDENDGRLIIAGKAARNMRSRIDHMGRILDLLETRLG
jgi:hypothetical protein